MPKLLLLDAYALIYRAYYGFIKSPIINSRGENTSAVFGFINTLEDLLRTTQPEYIAIAFDPPGGTFRHEEYPEYKAQREETPEGIRWAIPVLKDIIRAYNIKELTVPGFEADDVIGTVAWKAADAGIEVEMITPDKDYAQLVRPGVTMCRPGQGAKAMERLGVEEVCAKYNIPHPTRVIDLLGLMGDTADNIPGCPGVGPKTAEKLIADFGTVENLLANTDRLTGAVRKKVEANVDLIRLSTHLTRIRTDVPLELDLDALRRNEPDKAELRRLFERYEFRSFVKRYLGEAPKPKKGDFYGDFFGEIVDESTENSKERAHESLETTSHEYHLLDNEDELGEFCEFILTHENFAFDTETTSLEAIDADLVGMSFAVEGHRAWYVAMPADREAAQRRLEILRPVLESPRHLKVGQNLKYDLTVLASYGIEVAPPMFDTMLAHYLVQPEMRHNMNYLAEVYLNYETIHIEELIGPAGRKQKNMRDLRPDEIRDYACEDADVTLCLKAHLVREMEESGVRRVFDDIEMPLMPVLSRIERNGVRLDTEALAETGQQFVARLSQLEAEIYADAGHEFLITSPRQVGQVLFDELHLNDKAKKTKSGQYSTSEEVLEALRTKHPIVGKILAHRALKKLLSTYIEALPRLVNPRTGRIHTSFNQAVTATGRLSSSNPNLQNIPVRGEDGREIRKAFVPEEGCTFFSADYSQIELRIMAHLSGDEGMIRDFREGHDIHAATAARIFRKALDEVTRDERRKAKTANFGIIYGISAFGLAERMEVSRTEAKELIDNYFETYPKVRDFITKSIDKAREQGYITTEFGRRRYLPDINSRNGTVRGYAERNAVNAPIQGTAADIIKIAMIRIDERLRAEGLHAKMILQVHDELNFSVPEAELERLRRIVIDEMESAFEMQVPLLADCGMGDNWLVAH